MSIAPPALVRGFNELSAIEARLNNWRRKQDGIGLEAITKHLFHEAYQTARVIVDAPSRKKKPPTGGTNGGGI